MAAMHETLKVLKINVRGRKEKLKRKKKHTHTLGIATMIGIVMRRMRISLDAL